MRVLRAISAFSAFLASVICKPGSEYPWQYNWQHSMQQGETSSQPSISQLSSSQPSSSQLSSSQPSSSQLSSSQPSSSHPSSSQAYWQHNLPQSSQPNMQPILEYRREQIVEAKGYTEVAFFRDGQLFFINSYLQNLCSYHTAIRKIFCLHIGQGFLSFAVPVAGHPNKFVVGCDKNILMVKWNSYENSPYTPYYIFNSGNILPLKGENYRVGYGGVDYQERIWFATTNEVTTARKASGIYCLDEHMRAHLGLWDVSSVTGGFVWFPPPTVVYRKRPPVYKFYYADTQEKEILGYSTKTQATYIERREELFILPKRNIKGKPCRLAIDTRGWLWVPLLGGGGVVELNPLNGAIAKTIPIPARQVGACTFGGPNWQTLYVSTIRYEFKEPRKPAPLGDEGGYIYAIHGLQEDGVPISGVPTREYFVNDDQLRKASEVLGDPLPDKKEKKRKNRSGASRVKGSTRHIDLNIPFSL